MTIKFRIVCATRETAELFPTRTALGRSLALYAPYGFIELKLFPSNSTGLPALYNTALREAAADPAILVFVHDDILLCDYFWPKHLMDGLSSFDVVGLAGNKRRVPNQPGWPFIDQKFTPDDIENVTGIVGHGTGFPPENLTYYGPPGQGVKLLDGLLLAARSDILLSKRIFFDERFDFHFYDMDFCRQLEAQGLRMGTCMVSVIHQSTGSYSSPGWSTAYRKYLEKWQS
jgi:GT2 family glycosyltransferase